MAIHNITPLTENSGRTDYSLDTISDKDNLPKIGLVTGSTAQVYDGGELKVYYFTQGQIINNIEQEGTWDQI